MESVQEKVEKEMAALEAEPRPAAGAPGPRPPKKQAPKNRKKALLIAAAVLVLLALAGGLVWFFTRPKLDDTTQYWFDKAAEDGTLAGKTPQELQGMLDDIMEQGMVNVSMNSYVIFEDGTSEGSLGVENIKENRYYIRVILTNDADGSVLYESAGIKPGQYIDKITLNQDLPAGEYQCTATEYVTDPETLEDVGQVQVKVKVIVKA